ncbi:metal ABC transporter permease [Halalkalibacter nanhaiisediminis]|uniref:Zinc transport system permease protein n=1 Tax=Halalkalibacter nanhaiisediminis TaxID=688079 RepID=A0A562QNK5_9BACI|nr:metal ABC transporter permease [Halalkalibacter nanhaiisediminis]TWI57780.1 zinc transport system permease protein [Halalkalibacter nanhaiisediminis]
MDILLHLTFIERGLVAGVIIGFIAPIVGAFLLVRRVSVISESISHITLTGISAGVFLGTLGPFFQAINPMYLGVIFALLGALITERLRVVYRHFQELAIPIILSAGIGMSAIFISLARTGYNEWYTYLFGSIVSVTVSDIQFILGMALIVLIIIGMFYKEFISISFDQEFAKVSGISIRTANFVFALLIALVISMSMKVVGVLLVGAMIVIPVATSIQIAKSFKQLIGYGILFAEIAVISGMYVSYQYNIATGGMIVLMALLVLLFVILLKKISQLGR